jgi:phage-related protein
MGVELIYRGAIFEVYAWSIGSSCEVFEFIKRLERESNRDAERLVYLIKKTADHGPIRNEEQCRSLEGKHGEGLFEFKAPRGARILWFYDQGKIIVCAHGFVKKGTDTPRREIDRAQQVRQRYRKENTR